MEPSSFWILESAESGRAMVSSRDSRTWPLGQLVNMAERKSLEI